MGPIFRSSASLELDRCHRLNHEMFSFLDDISVAFESIGRSVRFCLLEFYIKEAIFDGCRNKNPGIGGGF